MAEPIRVRTAGGREAIVHEETGRGWFRVALDGGIPPGWSGNGRPTANGTDAGAGGQHNGTRPAAAALAMPDDEMLTTYATEALGPAAERRRSPAGHFWGPRDPVLSHRPRLAV